MSRTIEKKGRGYAGWGGWHTGEGARGGTGSQLPCPQGDGFHTDLEAIVLNERDAEVARAVAHARNKQWLGVEKAPHAEA